MHRACRRPEGIKAASDRLAIRFVITSGVAAPTGLSSVVPNAATRRNHSHHHRCRRRSCSLEIFHLALGLLASSIGSVPPAAAAAAANDIPLVCDYSRTQASTAKTKRIPRLPERSNRTLALFFFAFWNRVARQVHSVAIARDHRPSSFARRKTFVVREIVRAKETPGMCVTMKA